jgi:diguanylate cyclase (GGDEF)-like protein
VIDHLAESEDDLLMFDDERQSGGSATVARPWRILIVDDDEDVHTATLFALDNVLILGRRLEFLHAYSSSDARALLAREKDIAVILLDVVMEREDAGLVLVRHIRNDLGISEARIILRTGQPGYAPEIEAIRDYDINDYKTKSELTRSKLFTTLTASMRSYDQIRAINAGRLGLDRIVRGSAELIGLSGIDAFAGGVLDQLSGLLGQAPDGVVCAQDSVAPDGHPVFRVIAAAGRYAALGDCELGRIDDERLRSALEGAVLARGHRYDATAMTLYFGTPSGRDMVVFMDTTEAPDPVDRQLIDVFCSNIAVCLDNVALVSRLRNQAYFDSLVLLPNRVHFVETIDDHLAAPDGQRYAVVLVDIDHFAEINDALGHRYGDQLLKAVSARLRKGLPDGVMLARVAGDAFGVFGDSRQVSPSNLLALLTAPFDLDSGAQTLSATLGIARLEDVDGSGIDALKAASIALKRAKQEQRGNFAYFTRAMGVEIRERVKLLEDLRGAFACERLFLNFQPQVSLPDGHLVGFEALIRWKTETGRFVSPDQFIPLAEHSGLIVAIGEWVMRTACFQQKKLSDSGYPGLRMAINVSVVQFRQPRFLDVLDAALADSGVDPTCIELEITESVAMLEADYMVGMFNAIKSRGLQIAVDDFGTGFSSLSYLQRLSIDRLKIDRSFVNQMGDKVEGKSIAAMVIDLGNNLGLSVIAEGVEDAAQAVRLHKLGCHEAQGYHFGRPMDEDALRAWLEHRSGQRQ